MIKTIQYVSLALIMLMVLEGMFTLGNAFKFDKYNTFGWIAQTIIVVCVITTALRIVKEEK